MQERRASNNLGNDLLLQIIEHQEANSKILHELKGDVQIRLKSLETAQTRNWWMTYIATPMLMIAHGTARHFGVKI